jgi:hypothetical protein
LKNRTWAEAWNGKKWSIEPTPIPPATVSSSLSAVSCSSATACTAVGSYVTNLEDGPGTTLAESWNGKRWAIEPTPNPNGEPKYGALSGVSCTSATACTAVGEPRPDYRLDPVTLAESWNGTRWSIEPTPNPDAGYYNSLAAVSCTSASACTAVGSYGLDRTLGEAWNGKRWSIETTPNGTTALVSQLTAVSCTSAKACTAVGSYDNGTTLTLAEAWNGKTWAIQPTPNPTGATDSYLSAVSCTSATACTAVGSGDGPLAEAWNGTTWAIETFANPLGSLDGVSCTSATACTAVGEYLSSAKTTLTLAEAWNGSRWAVEPTPNEKWAAASYLDGVSCTSATACTAVGSSDKGNKSRTLVEAWNGRTWAIQTTPNQNGADVNGLSGVSCTSATACTAAGSYVQAGAGVVPAGESVDPMTLLEAWNGKKWAIERTPNPNGWQEIDLGAVSCTSATACTVVGGYFDNPAESGPGLALAEVWNGERWSIESTPNPAGPDGDSFAGVSCATATACTAVGSGSFGTGQAQVALVERLP